MNNFRKYIFFICLTFISYSVTFSQSISGFQDTLINKSHFKITKRFDNNKVKEACQFRRKGNYSFYDKFKIMPDSLFDFTIKQGDFIVFDKNGNEKKHKYYLNNKRKNKNFLGLKIGWWYGECWYAYYFLGLELTSTQWQPDF